MLPMRNNQQHEWNFVNLNCMPMGKIELQLILEYRLMLFAKYEWIHCQDHYISTCIYTSIALLNMDI